MSLSLSNSKDSQYLHKLFIKSHILTQVIGKKGKQNKNNYDLRTSLNFIVILCLCLCLSHLENDELSGSPDMSSPSQPLYLIPDNAVDEEHKEEGVDDEGALHNPHGDSVNVLQGRGCSGGVGGRQREGAGYEERK